MFFTDFTNALIGRLQKKSENLEIISNDLGVGSIEFTLTPWNRILDKIYQKVLCFHLGVALERVVC